ncbi:MAG TPA: glycosyltransferase [Gemmatimonadaceae bacterium]|nr:glycosyltransferase [Gemmatimonadaceae bacterium]
MTSSPLHLSIVVPVRNASSTLAAALTAIRASELERDRYELIVVDDASSDSSATIAARYADVVVRLNGRYSGPAYARNRGAELAKGDIVAFVDADVVVEPDTISRMISRLCAEPEIAGVSATHDDRDGDSNFVSEYWNLVLRFGEVRYAHGQAHFTSGCSAVRRHALTAAGMYDEWRFSTRGLGGLELGRRLHERGSMLVLDPTVKVRHLTRWTIRSICKEVWRRSSTLARSLGYQRTRANVPSEVVFTLSRALTPIAAVTAILIFAGAFLPRLSISSEVAVAVTALLLTNSSMHAFFARSRGFAFAAAAAPIHICAQVVSAAALCTGWILRDAIGDVAPDPVTQAYSEVGVQTWPPIPRRL